MNWQDRINSYAAATGFPPCFWIGEDATVCGMWVLGNDYRVKSQYYGGYPATYLRRVRALFPEKTNVLHLFSGAVDIKEVPGKRVDINSDMSPDYVDDAQTLTRVPLEEFDLILADPPYSVEDCDHYKTTMIRRNVVLRSLGKRVRPGCHVVWLDQVLPMYRKDQWKVEARIGVVKSTNHRFRVVTVFCKR